MNITTVVNDIKTLIAGATNYAEHQPRISENMTPVQDAPNTGVYRVVVMGTGQIKYYAGLTRYADLAIITANPLSGGDANKTNEDMAIQAERLLTVIADYTGSEAMTEESLESTLNRDAGRSIITISARILYKYSEE
jgi:hypothetical protein